MTDNARQSENSWLDRLAPLPKRIEVTGWTPVSPDALVVCADTGDLWGSRAAAELGDVLRTRTGTAPRRAELGAGAGKTVIRFLPPASRLHAELFAHPLFEDFTFHPGFQAYQVAALPGDGGLVVRALDAEGAYWGMKTLKQLLMVEGQRLVLPRVRIADGGDMEERGLWSQPFGTTSPHSERAAALAHYKAWIDWMSDHKLNLFEIMTVGEGGGLCYRSKTYPEFSHDAAVDREYFLRELIPYGEARGVRMVPIFSHPEHYGFIASKFPDLVPAHAVRHHGRDIRIAIDFFREGTARVLREIAAEVTDLFSPRGLCFWLAENHLHALPPATRDGRSEFLQEARTYHRIVEELRETHPSLGCRILLSQGSFPENLALLRALPPEVQWIYYSGERFGTYNIRTRNPIHRDIAAGAAEGRWISFCNSLRGLPARPTHLETIYRNVGHAVDAGLKGLDGMSYSYPGDEAALFVAGERAWNANGRSFTDTLRALATEAGAADPRRQAEAYALYDSATFAQSSRNSLGVGQPFGSFSRLGCMLERIRTNAPVDEFIMHVADAMETDDLPALAKAAADLEQALGLVAAEADAVFRYRCAYLLCVVRISRQVTEAFYINCREKCWDLYKGPWEGHFRAALRTCLGAVLAEAEHSGALFRQTTELEGWYVKPGQQEDPLQKTAGAAAAIDVDTVTSSRG